MTDLAAPSPTKWEYRFLVKQTDRQMLLELNHIGRDGWEAIVLSYDKDMKGVMQWTCWVKRPAGVCAAAPAVAAPAAASAAPAGSEATQAAAPAAAEARKPGDVPGFDLPDGDFELRD